MFYLDKQSGRRTPWTRGVFGMFVVVCLNLALQPCAMAMGTEQDRDCPHCPPSETQEHHGHHGVTVEEVDQTPCASASDDCGLGDDLNYDGRNTQLKLKDLPVDAPVAISNPIDIVAVARRSEAVDAQDILRQDRAQDTGRTECKHAAKHCRRNAADISLLSNLDQVHLQSPRMCLPEHSARAETPGGVRR